MDKWNSKEWEKYFIEELKKQIPVVLGNADSLKKFHQNEIVGGEDNWSVLSRIIANRTGTKVNLVWDESKIDSIIAQAKLIKNFDHNGASIDKFKEEVRQLIDLLEYGKQFNPYPLFNNRSEIEELYRLI